ncbi:hypothetical protein JCGZ_14704 [Jatropha curcas]|uniref:Uncharacterized protein n=1 Tax=Jatropha curcas TaxID=180498 RepID=A0A067K8C9_JATCU|nr:hypothetical protein JCGZ_14704 [Jatropha curcas]
MLGRVGRVIEAHELVKQLGEEGNVMEIWGSLLGACRLHGHIELGPKGARTEPKRQRSERSIEGAEQKDRAARTMEQSGIPVKWDNV